MPIHEEAVYQMPFFAPEGSEGVGMCQVPDDVPDRVPGGVVDDASRPDVGGFGAVVVAVQAGQAGAFAVARFELGLDDTTTLDGLEESLLALRVGELRHAVLFTLGLGRLFEIETSGRRLEGQHLHPLS